MPLVVIEGLNGAGKTTVTDSLGKTLGAKIISTSTENNFLPRLKKFLDNHPLENLLARFTYYLAINHLQSQRAKRHLEKDEFVIFDRYWPSTLATHLALDRVHLKGKHAKTVSTIVREEGKNLAPPDFVVFLQVNEAERKRRLRGRRSANDKLDWDERAEAATAIEFAKLAKALKKTVIEVLEVNTNKLSPDQTVSIIKRHLLASLVKKSYK